LVCHAYDLKNNIIQIYTMESYNLVLRSANKISGYNNAATFDINWSFLPYEYSLYEMSFSFQTAGGYLLDGVYDTSGGTYSGFFGLPSFDTTTIFFNSAEVYCELEGRSYSYDTENKCQSSFIGCIYRHAQTDSTLGASSILRCSIIDNPSKVVSRPSQNDLKINVYHTDYANAFFTDSDAAGTGLADDMPDWVCTIKFIPIMSSYSKT
jgi:hypothetical protein